MLYGKYFRDKVEKFQGTRIKARSKRSGREINVYNKLYHTWSEAYISLRQQFLVTEETLGTRNTNYIPPRNFILKWYFFTMVISFISTFFENERYIQI